MNESHDLTFVASQHKFAVIRPQADTMKFNFTLFLALAMVSTTAGQVSVRGVAMEASAEGIQRELTSKASGKGKGKDMTCICCGRLTCCGRMKRLPTCQCLL